LAKKTTKKVVACETCGEDPCACVKEEVIEELKLDTKEPVYKMIGGRMRKVE
tara:strand:- start:51 stop:206 length:156 start_codon:yes stop_codon:yes gene_type:complete